MALQYIIAAEKHLQAAESRQWDYPKGSTFKDAEEVRRALMEGKTIEEVYYQCIVKFGNITGFCLGYLGHTSHSARTAVRKGFKQLYNTPFQ